MSTLLRACTTILIFMLTGLGYAQSVNLARPSPVQYEWHEQERIMFIHFGVATWLGKEYDDDGKFDLARMNPTMLNTDDWCRVAQSWGAKQIIFVAKHVGGFCWWPTETTAYCVRNIPWKNGRGDLLGDVAASCRKFGLNLGVYIYPGDVKYGAGIGSGGKTSDPALQEAYNKVFRQQLTEVLTRYGRMLEVWFDGNCVIDVSDILAKYAKEAVIFQSPWASLRWPGTESGMLAYPAWNSLSGEKLRTGIATQYDDDPDGDTWAPLESDAPFYNHNWFWSPTNEQRRKSLVELMKMYYKSAGYGGVLLLNASPDTTGRITAGDQQRYAEFGQEINRRFSTPIKKTEGVKANHLTLEWDAPVKLNHTVLMEDYRQGHRIREYHIDARVGGRWKRIAGGISVGRKKIDPVATVTADAIRLTISKYADTPLLRSFAVYYVEGYTPDPEIAEKDEWKICGTWDTRTFDNGWDTLVLDLSPFIQQPGQYEVNMQADVAITGTSIEKAILTFDHDVQTQQEFLQRPDHSTFYINRTAQVTLQTSVTLTLSMKSDNKVFQNRGTFRIRPRAN